MTEPTILARAEEFMWSNARLLERRQFAHLFKGAAAEPVRAALHAYQNEDGGFGNALEPDKRCPDSQPIDQEMALHALDDVGIDAAVVGRMCDFLATISTAEGGVPFVLPTVRSAPRAPWWNTEDDPPASLNPTASIAGLLHKQGFQHAWLDRATDYCWSTIGASQLDEPHLILAIITFLENAPDQPRARREFERVATSLFEHELVVIDPDDARLCEDAARLRADAAELVPPAVQRRGDRRASGGAGRPPAARRRLADRLAGGQPSLRNGVSRDRHARCAADAARVWAADVIADCRLQIVATAI